IVSTKNQDFAAGKKRQSKFLAMPCCRGSGLAEYSSRRINGDGHGRCCRWVALCGDCHMKCSGTCGTPEIVEIPCDVIEIPGGTTETAAVCCDCSHSVGIGIEANAVRGCPWPPYRKGRNNLRGGADLSRER